MTTRLPARPDGSIAGARRPRSARRGLAALCLTAAALPAAGAQAATARVGLRIPSAVVTGATKHVQDFSGQVTFAPPAGWARRLVTQNGEQLVTAKFTRTLAPGCVATAYVSTDASVSRLGPIGQLRPRLPADSEPGVIFPAPVTILAAGRTTRGDGGWILAAPPAASSAWALYGGGLVRVAAGYWAGLRVGISGGAGCAATLPNRSALVVAFGRLLGGLTLSQARVGRRH